MSGIVVRLFALFLLSGASFGAVEIIQDGNFILEYDLIANDTTLNVTATVKATGWVGVGLSTSGSMINADMIMGGVKDGNTSYCGDYFAFSNSRPIEDLEDNVLTYSASENATHTVLHFTRLADTGDELEDVTLESATHIIWGYHTDSDDPTYHGGEDRGAIPLNKTALFIH